jgi:hypothetical protein
MVVEIQIEAFWVVKPCSVSSETLVSYCNTTWHHNSEDLDLSKINIPSYIILLIFFIITPICA